MSLPPGRRLKFSDIENRPFPRRDIVQQHVGDGWSRLEIATRKSPVGLMVDCLSLWPSPYIVLYVALDGFAGYEAGRYESPAIEDFENLRYFLFQFQEFFEDDARHNLWVYSPRDNQQVIYDRHEILYVYGDDGRVLSMLLERGFSHARPPLPVPHSHHYHHEFTSTHEELMGFWDWHRKPLQPGDDS